MTSHTPGPWYRNINAKYPVFAGEAPKHVHIASILKGAPESEREANLRLIAAAPELLAALEQLERYSAGDDLSPYSPDDINYARSAARAAITKAKGD